MLRREFLVSSVSTAIAGATGSFVPSLARATGDGGGPVVRIAQGDVRGAEMDGVSVFKGLPFAAPPTGVDRFWPPRSREPWAGVRDALRFGPKAPQSVYPPQVAMLVPPEETAPGDDCLTLNIWSSDLGARQPVMVWIAGGLFEYHATGASPWYDGSSFARGGVVLVTINYRVGAAGFLHLGDGIANVGLLDQVAALEWVRDNIASFGGDPATVTIFGESAGASSVAILCSMPRAAGLFRRAIVESGGGQHVSPGPIAKHIGERFAATLGVEPTRAAIAAVGVDRQIAAQEALKLEIMSNPDPTIWGEVAMTTLPWQPVIDGDILSAAPVDLIRDGASKAVDLMIGTNTEETRLFFVPTGVTAQIPEEALAGTIASFGLPVQETLTAYRVMHPGAAPGDLFAALNTDWGWRIPALRLAEAHVAGQNGSSTYMYEFAWRSPQFGGLGAAHAVEIPFVFKTLDKGTEQLLGPDPPPPLADKVHGAWVTFAKTGNPGWPAYDLERRATMRFDTASSIVDDSLATERRVWEGVR